jgi:hypothetical protein
VARYCAVSRSEAVGLLIDLADWDQMVTYKERMRL